MKTRDFTKSMKCICGKENTFYGGHFSNDTILNLKCECGLMYVLIDPDESLSYSIETKPKGDSQK